MKAIVSILLAPVASLYRLRYAVLRRLMPADKAFELCSEALARKAGLTGVVLRRLYYRAVLPACGRDCTFAHGAVLTKAGIRLGDRVALGLNCVVSAAEFGSDVLVGPGVLFLSGRAQHGSDRLDVPMARQPGVFRTIRIGSDCWIGAGAVVTDDVGDGAIVAAGAVVVAPVAPFSVVGGNPARVIGTRPVPDAAPAQSPAARKS